jgi:hypothetical protein
VKLTHLKSCRISAVDPKAAGAHPMAALEFLARPAIAALVAPDLTRESRKPPLRRRRLSPQPRDLAPLPSQLMLGFGTEPGLVRREFRHLGSCGIVISAERLRRQRGRMHRTVPALFSHPLYLSSACSYSIDSHDPVGNAGCDACSAMAIISTAPALLVIAPGSSRTPRLPARCTD